MRCWRHCIVSCNVTEYPILDALTSPLDLQEFAPAKLDELAAEIRARILEVVSQNGGHLASSLGTVELTLALHKIFNNPKDRIVWDVGHQAYAHKLITGRHGSFDTLRLTGGISGFLKPTESEYDAFVSGHAGSSVSVAFGMAIARDLLKENHKVLAVIGDGAMACGMPFEALNHGGQLDTDLVVVLNDNKMSISKNVGALAKYLNSVVQSRMYNVSKTGTREFVRKYMPGAERIISCIRRFQESIKGLFVPSILFEDLGFRYIGPVDGHNIQSLLHTFAMVHSLREPVLVHVVTQKGKGYDLAECDPCSYHGTPKFDPDSGVCCAAGGPTFTSVFGEKVLELARKDTTVVAITAAMPSGTGLEDFAKELPKQFFDVGIAEGHAVTCAGGMAKAGLKPIVAIYSSFLQRSYDSIMHDVLLQKLPVIFAIDRAGFVGADGATHHGLYDIAYLRAFPELTLIAPRDAAELAAMLEWAIAQNAPVAIRYPRASANPETLSRSVVPVELGKPEVVVQGDCGVVLVAYGSIFDEAEKAASILSDKHGLNVTLVNARFAKPLDENFLLDDVAKKHTKLIITIEEGTVRGGFGSGVNEVLVGHNIAAKIVNLGVPDVFIEHGTQDEQRIIAGISAGQIVDCVLAF